MDANGCEEEEEGARLLQPGPHLRGGLCPAQRMRQERRESELGAGDLLAGLEGLLDGGLVGLAGGVDAQPLGIEGVLVVDLDGLGLAGA